MIGVTSSNATVTAYAVKTSSGMNLMLVNHSPHTSEPVSIAYAGFNPASVTSAEQFSDANPKLSALSGANARSLTLPAYSITVLKLSGSSPRAAHLTARLFTSRTPSALWCAWGRKGASTALCPVPAAPPASQVLACTYGVAAAPRAYRCHVALAGGAVRVRRGVIDVAVDGLAVGSRARCRWRCGRGPDAGGHGLAGTGPRRSMVALAYGDGAEGDVEVDCRRG